MLRDPHTDFNVVLDAILGGVILVAAHFVVRELLRLQNTSFVKQPFAEFGGKFQVTRTGKFLTSDRHVDRCSEEGVGKQISRATKHNTSIVSSLHRGYHTSVASSALRVFLDASNGLMGVRTGR